jgi:hypothetical protein
MQTINLTIEEIQQVTGRVKPCAQLRWFKQNGFTAKVRADGRPLVSRAHFESMMGGNTAASTQTDYELDLGAI